MSKSVIYLDEKVDNTKRKFGAIKGNYYPIKVINENGSKEWAMFTHGEINKAILRAEKNPEDIPQTIWTKMVSWFK